MGEYKIYPLKHPEKFSAFVMAYWLIQKRDDGLYDILNVKYV